MAAALLVACGGTAGGGTANDETGSNGAGEAVADTASATRSETIVLTVPSMSCPLCSRSIEARLMEAGVRDIQIDLETKRVTATFDPSRITAAEVEALVEGQGFPVTESQPLDGPELEVEP